MYKLLQPSPLEGEGAILARIKAAGHAPQNFVEKDNKYQKVYTNTLVAPTASVSTTLDQLERKIDRNLHMVVYREIVEDSMVEIGDEMWCNAFPVGSGTWVMAGHQFVRGKTYIAKFSTHPGIGIKRFEAMLNEANLRWAEDCDLVFAHLPQGGDTADFSKYMVDSLVDFEIPKNAPLFVYHAHHSVVTGKSDFAYPSSYKMVSKIQEMKSQVVHHNGIFVGKHDMIIYEGDNHPGMCGSMVFIAGRNPILIGVHTAGRDRTCGCTPIDKLYIPQFGGVKIAEENAMTAQTYGKDVVYSPNVHEFSPIHYLEEEANVEVYGQHNLPLSRFRTDIIESPMKSAMEEVLNYEPTHGPPERKAANPSRRRHLEDTTRMMPPSNPRYLEVAKRDFEEKLSKLVLKGKFLEFVHPISYEEALSGVAGVKGFDPLNPTTSMGWPLNSAKWKFMLQSILKEKYGLDTVKFVSQKEIDGRVVFVYSVVFDKAKADVELEVENVAEWFIQGKRANLIFRVNLKDEAITFKKIKDKKIRAFAGAPVAMVIICRMLTLPLINMMTHFPDAFESAVGVDATGRDWEEIANMVSKFGTSRCGDGDFSGFDVHLRPEFMKAAFDILHFILVKAGYSEEMLAIFSGLATECMFPIYESDGLVFKAFGSNPSGNPLTVILNGLCNSLYMRYVYYSLHKTGTLGKIPLFHEVVSLMTYGDDNTFSVSEEETLFNMQSIGEVLDKIGVKYTDASKKISEVPFKDFSQVSFLKRKFHPHPQLGAIVGCLEKESIYKSLALTRKPKKDQRESVAEICAGNLNGALRELYFHSEEEYLLHLPKFREIAHLTVDSEGHRVSDYFKPFTIEDIRNQFLGTTCCYQAAKDALECQSGVVDDSIERYRNRRDRSLIPAEPWLVDIVAVLPMHFVYWRNLDPGQLSIGESIVMPPPVSVGSIEFWNFCSTRMNWIIRSLVDWDVRMQPDFHEQILLNAVGIRRSRERKKGIAERIEYLFERCQSPCVAISRGDVKIRRMFLMKKRRESPLFLNSQDLTAYIWDFFDSDWDLNYSLEFAPDGVTIRRHFYLTCGDTSEPDCEWEIRGMLVWENIDPRRYFTNKATQSLFLPPLSM
jgi:hypothetical protein